jgi:hypothetical protein
VLANEERYSTFRDFVGPAGTEAPRMRGPGFALQVSKFGASLFLILIWGSGSVLGMGKCNAIRCSRDPFLHR